MRQYFDNDYETYYYNVEDMKSELGMPPHSRKGHFERTIARLNENEGLILDWIMDRRDYRMVSPSGALELLSEFKRTLPAKLRARYEAKVDEMIRSVLFDWFRDEYDLDFTTRAELTKCLAQFRDWKLPDYLHGIYDEQAEKLFEILSWGLK